MNANSLTTTPNLLSLSRVPLAVLLCAAIHERVWLVSLILFSIASFTDWLDGWWARRFNQQSLMGRNLDPLTDKVLIGCAFIFLQSANVGVAPWMVAVMIGRELLVTGLRGIVEATGAKFGADWFGKLKTVLQCVTLFAIFLVETLRDQGAMTEFLPTLSTITTGLLYAAIVATLGSGVQYCVKAMRLLAL
ncbi:hypothetical protein BH11PLA2_BH11PLA2_35360 [soil metagenome]